MTPTSYALAAVLIFISYLMTRVGIWLLWQLPKELDELQRRFRLDQFLTVPLMFGVGVIFVWAGTIVWSSILGQISA